MQAPIEESRQYQPAFPRKSAEEKGLIVVPAGGKPSRGLWMESLYPVLCGALVVAVTAQFRTHTSLFAWDEKAEFLTKVIDLAAGLLAYALTVVTVLPALADRESIRLLKRRGAYRYFVSYIGSALGGAAWLVAFSLALKLFFNHVSKHHHYLAPACSSLWWGSLTYATMALFRASRLLLSIISGD